MNISSNTAYDTVKCHTIIQCWTLAPLLAPPRNRRKLKKVAHVAVALKQKIMVRCGGSGAKIKWRLFAPFHGLFSSQILHRNVDKFLFFLPLKNLNLRKEKEPVAKQLRIVQDSRHR